MTPTVPTSASAPGETALSTLLSTLTSTLHPQIYVFLTYPSSAPPPPSLLTTALLTFQEPEGLTLITPLVSAEEHQIKHYTFPCKLITCNVHSSLEAVGFMAAITAKLTERSMSVNPVSGYFHDHLFVPVGREEEAVELLEDLAREARAKIVE